MLLSMPTTSLSSGTGPFMLLKYLSAKAVENKEREAL